MPGTRTISAFDRSYLYGDSLYEVVRSYGGRILEEHLQAHLNRLSASAALCRMNLDQGAEELGRQMRRTLEFFHAQPFGKSPDGDSPADAYCRIVISRGVGRIGFGRSQLLSPTQYTIIVQPVEIPSPRVHQRGLHLQIVERIRNDRRALDPAMKSGNYLNNVLAFLEAQDAGFDDALLVDAEGNLTEGTTFNLFYARRGILCTPPLDVGVLEGITRATVIQLAREKQIEVREVRFPKQRLYDADEVFVTSTLKEVMAVTRVDDRKIGTGRPGPITRRLQKAFSNEITLLQEADRQRGDSE